MAAERPSDYSWGPGKSPTTGAFNAGFAAYNATVITHWVHEVSPWWGIGVGAVAAAASVLTLAVDNHLRFTEGRAMCYRAACWMGAGIWSTVQLSLHPWSWNAGVFLAAGVAAAAIVGEGLRYGESRRRAEADEKVRRAEEAKERARLAREAEVEAAKLTEEERIAAYWQPRFRKICRLPTLVIEGVEIWPTGDGYTLGGLVPDDGSTVETSVKPHEKALATSADMHGGCNVEIVANIDGQSRRVFHARINTVNAMAEDQPYPDDYSDRSIVDPIPLGVASNRAVGGVSLLDDSLVLIGQTGSGKSTTLNTATGGCVRCTDALVLAIDKKGLGEYPRRWCTAWHEGRAERPAIHLVAVNDEMAELMTLGILNIVKGRPVAYAKDMLARGERKIMPTPQLPQIILIVDEFKSLSDAVKANIELIKDQGRSAAVEIIVCSLEATGAAIPRTLIKQCRERVGMRFNDEAELQHLFDSTWKSGRFDPASMTHPGMMLLSTGAKPPMQHKGYDMTPQQIDEMSIVVGRQRPPLDDASIAMFDTVTRRIRDDKGNWTTETLTGVYTSWWDNTRPLMFGTNPQDGEEMVSVGSSPTPPPATRTASADPFGDLAASGDSLARSLERLRAEAAAADAGQEQAAVESVLDPNVTPAQDHDADFAAIVAGYELDLPSRQHYYEILREVGEDGIGGTEMAERLRAAGHPTVRPTVQDWFVEDFGYRRVLKLPKGRYRWNPDQGV